MFKIHKSLCSFFNERGIKKLYFFFILCFLAFGCAENTVSIGLYSFYTTDGFIDFVIDFCKNCFGAGFGVPKMGEYQMLYYTNCLYGLFALLQVLKMLINDKKRDDIKEYLFWCISVVFFAVNCYLGFLSPCLLPIFVTIDKFCDIFGNVCDGKISNKNITFKKKRKQKKNSKCIKRKIRFQIMKKYFKKFRCLGLKSPKTSSYERKKREVTVFQRQLLFFYINKKTPFREFNATFLCFFTLKFCQ